MPIAVAANLVAADDGLATYGRCACGQRPGSETGPLDRSRIGPVKSIEPIRERLQGTGAGAVIGGALGAVVGNNVERDPPRRHLLPSRLTMGRLSPQP